MDKPTLWKRTKSLLNRYYWLDRNYNYLRFWLSHFYINKPIVVYQMGKVGSTTIYEGLKKSVRKKNLFHVHVLTKEGIKKVERRYCKASKLQSSAIIDQHIIESLFLRKKLDRGKGDEKWKVISLVRDPVARNISAFFQAFKFLFPEKLNYGQKSGGNIQDLSVNELISIFFNEYNHDTTLNWFDNNILHVFGINVYEKRFDFERNFITFESDICDLLVLRTEDIDSHAKEAFSEFLNIKINSFDKKKESYKHTYAETYMEFKKQITFSEAYINRMYNSKYMKNFYNKNEIDNFRDKWKRR